MKVENDCLALTQVSLEKGLKLLGKKGEEAVESDIQQLHDMEALQPVRGLMIDEKCGAQGYLIYLKE